MGHIGNRVGISRYPGIIESNRQSVNQPCVRQHDPDHELIGQGIGNMVAGVFGGIPGTGATMRSEANIRTGGRTPISGVFHAVILLAILL